MKKRNTAAQNLRDLIVGEFLFTFCDMSSGREKSTHFTHTTKLPLLSGNSINLPSFC